MAIESKIYSLLSGTTVITGTVGTRIYPGMAPQTAVYPFLIYTKVSTAPQNGLSGYLTLENTRVQIDAYSTSYTQAKNIADNVHTVMNGSTTFKCTLQNDMDMSLEFAEEDSGIRRVLMEFSCWNRE